MGTNLIPILSQALQSLAAAIITYWIYDHAVHFNVRRHLARIPRIKSQETGSNEEKRQLYIRSAKALYNEGYETFTDQVYRMCNSSGEDSIVIPRKFLDEMRRLPEDTLSAGKAVADFLEVKYTKILAEEDIVAHTIKADLTPALLRYNPVISRVADEAIQADMPRCNDWTAIHVFDLLTKIVAKLSGRIFVGPDLFLQKEYLEMSLSYTHELMAAQRRIKSMRPFLRPILGHWTSEVRQLRMRERFAEKFFLPVVRARLETQPSVDGKQPDDMLQWLLNRREQFQFDTMAKISKLQLGLIFTALHTTVMTATNIFYSLAVTPQYIDELRTEIREAVADSGGTMDSKALSEMIKLDSYMKEVFRVYNFGSISFLRKVLKGITLSNGQYIPPGVDIEAPTYSIYHDSDLFPDPEKFDGFRSYKLRQESMSSDVQARNTFVNVNDQNLGFGYGRHACPGRFFANNEIKMILAKLLLHHDVKMPDGLNERWPNINNGAECMPDPTKTILFKKAKVPGIY
ncbi:cytochrome P450 [Elsinoe ampelina]|uniref:Cytochrome P450 n=1 Tax=Elsinoe ampelina TaxID=302913 RepID=A0A6A6FY43_9PEZI|nr:cytochrome P450 [Elsinoe ampelina]